MDKDFQEHDQEPLDMDHAEAEEVLEDLAFYRTLAANVCMIGKPTEDWILVDTSVAHYSNRIIAACEKRFGDKAPKAIILTHGHFDHVGSAYELAKYWDVPIYIHQAELDYVTGKKNYPPADPTVGGGVFSLLSPLFPTKAANLKNLVQTLPPDGNLPFLDDWIYIHTPGHSEGHIALFREKDKTLISGDAITTEKPESTMAAFFPLKKVHGPPAYFTQDWNNAEKSVLKIAALQPKLLLSGHGLPMEGDILTEQLDELANNFMELAIPKNQRH